AVTGLTANTPYYYRVRAVNAGGTSGNSNTITVTTLVSPPAAPVATAATSVAQTSFTANWDASSGATSYRLDVSTDAGFTSFVTGYNNKTVAGISDAVTGLTASTPYYYRVRAVNAGGTSGNSNTISVTTLVSPPAAPVATDAP
ncbi:MAG: fibronectin type III domain-containing protein, partial [Proteobacteria bacterium]|nr:fibronectin type III domain-containing protein [Pseudomonadota bacterium]